MISLRIGSYLKSILVLASGSVLAQLIVVLCAPILTRLFSPEVMGAYTYLLSVCAIFLGIVNLRYDMSIVSEDKEENVFPLIKLATMVGVLVTIIASVGVSIYFYESDKPLIWIAYIFTILLSYGLINVFTAYNNRQKEFKVISNVYIIRRLAQNLGPACIGILSSSVHVLLLSYVAGQFLGIRSQTRTLKNHIREIIHVPKSKVKEVLLKHKRQPLFSTPALLINSLSYSLITIFIEELYGMQEVGFYSISVRLLGLPLVIIAGNVSKVFMEKASREYDVKGDFFPTLKNTFLLLLLIAIPMVAILMLFSTPVCTFVFGSQWSSAGVYVTILAPMFGIRFINSTLTPAFIILGKQKNEFYLQLLFLISVLGSYLICLICHLDIRKFLLFLSVSFSVSYFTYLISIFVYSVRNRVKE